MGSGWREESKQVQGAVGRKSRGGGRQRRERRGRESREGRKERRRKEGRKEGKNYQKVSVEPLQRCRTVVLKQRGM